MNAFRLLVIISLWLAIAAVPACKSTEKPEDEKPAAQKPAANPEAPVAESEPEKPVRIIENDTIYIGETREYMSLGEFFGDWDAIYRNLVVYVEAGTYYDDAVIKIRGKNLHIEGIGQVNLYATQLYSNVMWLTSASHVTVRNFRMVHLNQGDVRDQNCSGRVMGFDDAEYIRVENCDLNGCGLAGLHDNGGNKEIFILNCHIHNNSLAAITNIEGDTWNAEVKHPTFFFENNRIENNGPGKEDEEDPFVSVYDTAADTLKLLVEQVAIPYAHDSAHTENLPRVRFMAFHEFIETKSSTVNEALADNINRGILNSFMLESYTGANEQGLYYSDITLQHEVKDSLLYIHTDAVYNGAYPQEVSNELIFNYMTGKQLEPLRLPFHLLFTSEGILTFLQQYLAPVSKPAFAEAEACADAEPYCSQYDIANYHMEDGILKASLNSDCYPRVVRACTPFVEVSVRADSLEGLLSDMGRKILLEDDYTSKKAIARYQYLVELQPALPDMVLMEGTANGQKVIISYTLSPDNTVEGYWWQGQGQPIEPVMGRKASDDLIILETSAGTIQLQANPEGDYKRKAFWINKKTGDSLNINIDLLHTNKL